MEKIIFLDIDGVISTPETNFKLTHDSQSGIGKIIKATGAKIVLSSSWRFDTLETTIDYMEKQGFEFCHSLIGVTIRAYHYLDKKQKIHLSIPRGVEIKQWLDTHVHSNNGVDYNSKRLGIDYSYVILDDDTDMLLEQKDYFVNTDGDVGLTDQDVLNAITILNAKIPD